MSELGINFSSVTVGEMVDRLSGAYVALLRAGKPLKSFPPVMLWGAPGIGKSQGVRAIAKRIAAETGKRVNVTDVRLLLFNPVDLRGIPTANEDRTLAVWLKPKIFQMEEGEGTVNLLLLDEISAAPPSVQAAAYQITLDRTVGEHKLPDNCIVLAAGNRVTDRSVAYAMPKALANRLCHLELVNDAESWHRWAVRAGIHRIVLGFLEANPEWLMEFDPQNEDLAFPTPRSWEMVSHILGGVSENVHAMLPLIVGCVGKDAAYELFTWSEIYGSLPDVEEIFAGACPMPPQKPNALFALSSMIVSYAWEHRASDGIRNAVKYVYRLPHEFKNRIYKDLLEIGELRELLSNIREYDDWFARSGREWDRYGVC
ncbi:MAG: AAA family ATPase [Clostridia bacterium]|nr:AAA family ATPase [Clostridia bacterium]